jgi:hypothetical protein
MIAADTGQAMSVHPQDYPHDPPRQTPLNPKAGMAYPPKDYAAWRELMRQWVARKAEVENWYWEVWNEPNIALKSAATMPAESAKAIVTAGRATIAATVPAQGVALIVVRQSANRN